MPSVFFSSFTLISSAQHLDVDDAHNAIYIMLSMQQHINSYLPLARIFCALQSIASDWVLDLHIRSSYSVNGSHTKSRMSQNAKVYDCESDHHRQQPRLLHTHSASHSLPFHGNCAQRMCLGLKVAMRFKITFVFI